MNKIQDHPAYYGRNAYATPFTVLDVTSQIRVLVDSLGQEHLLRSKVVSTKTANDRSLICSMIFKQLAEGGFKPRSVLGISAKHIEYLARRWEQEALSPATIQTRFSLLRWFAAAIGKGGLIRDPSYYGLAKPSFARVLVAQEDKSWSTQNVNIQDVLSKVEPIDNIVAVQLRLMHEFGLRLREAILMRPALSHVGDTLRVEEGTKGGRTRVVLIRYDTQLQALELAKAMSRHCRKGSLVPEGHNFDTTRNRFYYVMRLCGITKSQLGVTSHGLRHEYANDLYEELSGQPSVVRGASEILDRAKDRAARKAVTSDLGHVRLDVTAAYTGSMRSRRTPLPPKPDSGQTEA